MHIHTYIHTYIHMHAYMRAHTHAYIHVYTCISQPINKCMRAYHKCIHTYVERNVHIHKLNNKGKKVIILNTLFRLYTHTYLHIYIYIYSFHNVFVQSSIRLMFYTFRYSNTYMSLALGDINGSVLKNP